jgi:recombination protein RecA
MIQAVRFARALPGVADPRTLTEPLEGKLVELSGGPGSARLTLAATLIRRAQMEGETTAWIQPASAPGPYLPDLFEAGIDPEALPFIRLPASAEREAPFRAAEMLVRSGAFGLVVLDVRCGPRRIPAAVQGRLLAAAREHRSRVVLLTEKDAGTESAGSLIGIRVEPRRIRVGRGTYVIETQVLKNKQGTALDDPVEHRRGPWGLA